MTESPIKWPSRDYNLNYLNSSRSDAVEKDVMKHKKTTNNCLMDSGNTYNKSPLLSDCFLLRFVFINSALLHLLKSWKGSQKWNIQF